MTIIEPINILHQCDIKIHLAIFGELKMIKTIKGNLNELEKFDNEVNTIGEELKAFATQTHIKDNEIYAVLFYK